MKTLNFELTGKRIKELRTDKGLSQKVLGDKIGVQQGTVADYERGKACPSCEVILLLAQIFDTTTDYLLGLVDFE